MLTFLIINAIFLAIFIWLVVLQPSWLVWAIFIAVWCVADVWFAKDIHLKWWHWAGIIALLCVIDLIALRILGQI